MIRVGQLRAVQRAAYFRPQGRRRVFILDGADTMRWNDADVFLKILEEPPDSATLILMAPTARLRAADNPLALPAIPFRARRIETNGRISRRSHGIEARRTKTRGSTQRRQSRRRAGARSGGVLATAPQRSQLIAQSVDGKNYREIFKDTAQLAKQEKESFENILALFYSLFTDLLELSVNPKALVAAKSRPPA